MSETRRNNFAGVVKRLLIWLLVLAAWEGAYRIIGWKSYKFPAPSHIVDSLLDQLNIRTTFGKPISTKGWPISQDPPPKTQQHVPLITANLVSGVRLLLGFILSISIGGTIGIAMWRFKPLDEFLGPLLLGLQTLPSVCWVPLAILTYGLNESAVMFVLVMGSFSAIAIALRDGLTTMPPLYRRAGLMLGASGWRLYRYVLLPASLPAFATSLRQGFSFAWRSLLGAELILTAVQWHGLGFLLDSARNVGGVADVIAIMIVMVVIGMIADRWVFAKLQKAVNARFGLG